MTRTTPRRRLALSDSSYSHSCSCPRPSQEKAVPALPALTIKLVPLNPSTDGVLHYRQQVTFDVYTSSTAYPWVLLECSQNGSLVYQYSKGIFPTSLGQIFTLGPTPAWTGGAADCTASLQKWDGRKKTTLATLNFHVYA